MFDVQMCFMLPKNLANYGSFENHHHHSSLFTIEISETHTYDLYDDLWCKHDPPFCGWYARRCAVEMLVAKGGVRTHQARGRDEFP